MLISDIIQALEEFAPRAYQESYDNAGLCVGNARAEARGALLCLDVTEAVVQEAVDKNINLIISHHPVIFSGVRQLTGSTAAERIVQQSIKRDIALYAAHTNLDSVRGGVSEKMCDKLGLANRSILQPAAASPGVGLGMVGELPAALSAADFLQRVKKAFGSVFIKYANTCKKNIHSVAVCGGSGSALITSAVRASADAFVTGDLKYHELQAASEHLMAVDVGHYESEIAAVEIFFEVITKKFPTFVPCLSLAAENPVKYT